MMRSGRRSQGGFTVIELMVATAVFSVVLVVLTTGVLAFSRQYYKGVISSNTQNTARNIADEIGRAIQFGGAGVPTLVNNGTVHGICVGASRRYSYAPNVQVTDSGASAALHQNIHGLVVDNTANCSAGTQALAIQNVATVAGASGAHELLAQHMRLVNLSVTQGATADVWNITVRVAYGDDDLLCSPSHAGCGPAATLPANISGYTDLSCKSTIGSQFCAVSELATTVVQRVQ